MGSNTPANTVAFGIIMSFFDREWTSMLLSTATCQKKISADQYHVTISQAKVLELIKVMCFFYVDC